MWTSAGESEGMNFKKRSGPTQGRALSQQEPQIGCRLALVVDRLGRPQEGRGGSGRVWENSAAEMESSLFMKSRRIGRGLLGMAGPAERGLIMERTRPRWRTLLRERVLWQNQGSRQQPFGMRPILHRSMASGRRRAE